MARFDRSACAGPLNGPDATGAHCPEGWTLFAEPLPGGLLGWRSRVRYAVDAAGRSASTQFNWVVRLGACGRC